MLTPQAPRRRRSQKGFEDRNSHGPSLRSALHSRAQALRAAQARPSKAMARAAVWTFSTPSVCAEERRARGGGCAAGHTRFVNWLAVVVRAARCKRKASSTAHPVTEHRRLPAAKRRDADSRVAFFCLLFLARQEKKVPCRGHIPAPALNKSTAITIKTIATSACQISARAQNASKYPGQPKRSNLRDSEPAQPRNRLAQRLVLLGETEAHHALVEAVAIEGR